MAHQFSLRLPSAAGYPNDDMRRQVRIEPKIMKKLNAGVGSIIKIISRYGRYCSTILSGVKQEDIGKGFAFIGKLVQNIIGVNYGEEISLQILKNIELATKIVLFDPTGLGSKYKYLNHFWEGNPITEFDVLPLWNEGMPHYYYVIAFHPHTECVIITSDTKIRIYS